jgi:hypothetical protein
MNVRLKRHCKDISSQIFSNIYEDIRNQGAPPVATTPVVLVDKFVAGVVDTSGKCATCVIDIGNNLPLVSLMPVVHLDF